MKLKVPLHYQILAALFFGAVFGAIFSIPNDAFILKHSLNNHLYKETIEDYKEISLLYKQDENSFFQEKIYKSTEQGAFIKQYNSLSKYAKKNINLKIIYSNKEIKYLNISAIEKIQTIATAIKPIGTIFIRLLSFLAIPLVIATLIVGAASIEDVKKLGRIGSKTLIIYIATTAIAITFGLVLANVIKPGEQVTASAKDRLVSEFQAETSDKISQNLDVDLVDFVVNIVPQNPIKAMAEGNMLQIVFFAVIFGAALTFIDKKKSSAVVNVLDAVSDVMIKLVGAIMKIAPYGVFALIAATIADFGFEIIYTLFWYMFTVLFGLFLHTVVTYSLIVKGFGKMSPVRFFKGMQTAQAIAFSTSSSAATLPVTMSCVENNLGISKKITSFVLPLGATINMDGTALYQGVAAVFIAQVYGIDLSIVQQLTIIFTATLASIGTAPVPGVGIIMLVMILQSINLPPEGIALILGVDRILDMARTITNISGDAAVCVAVARSENGS
ncbi:MAG TPA: dicarboxylate/amino acid:cation symporter [Candidatus Kapabacteria bacterium]|nr:dicarboxylate/amino acid:cation symporter [Candidatus Kapabacteria bacterium]HPO63417.1 dicarboxylate/amino acid:cation symporter [Candidatus Kapabacteria bacterium]